MTGANAVIIIHLYNGAKDPQVANCSVTTVRLEGSFGGWGQKNTQDKFRTCNLTRKGSGLLDEQTYLTSWEEDRRERERREVAKKLGEVIMEGSNILLIVQKIDMVYWCMGPPGSRAP